MTNQSFDTAWGDTPEGEQPTAEVLEQTTDESVEELETPEVEEESTEDSEESSDVVDYKALYEKTKNDLESATGRFKAKVEELRRQGVVPADAEPAPAARPSTDPDEEFLSNFQQTYQPEVARAIDIISKRNARELVQSYIEQNLTPVYKTTQDLVAQAHFGRIEAAHPDVYAIAASDEFNEWIESKPVHLRNAYIAVRDEGSPEEVISMLNEYKDFKKPTKSTQKIDSQRVGAATAVPRARAGLPSSPVTKEKSFDTAWET